MKRLISLATMTALAIALGLPLIARADDGDTGHYAFARVVSSAPIYRTIRVDEPDRYCYDEDVAYARAPGRSNAGIVEGGIVGGLIGHQIGHGRGRTAATIVGAIIGSSIGHRAATRPEPYVTTERRCEVTHRYREEQRVEGYDVTYVYNGDEYTTRMSHDPGDRIRVWVSVQPVEY